MRASARPDFLGPVANVMDGDRAGYRASGNPRNGDGGLIESL